MLQLCFENVVTAVMQYSIVSLCILSPIVGQVGGSVSMLDQPNFDHDIYF